MNLPDSHPEFKRLMHAAQAAILQLSQLVPFDHDIAVVIKPLVLGEEGESVPAMVVCNENSSLDKLKRYITEAATSPKVMCYGRKTSELEN